MTEEGKNVIKSLITFREEEDKKKINQIQFDSYFKHSGLIEYKKRLKEPSDEIKIKEKTIIKNDMSKYKFKNK
jgi:hypothetical protein